MTATPVAPLSASVQALCPVCGKPATWAIGPNWRSCTKDLGTILEGLHKADPHPFQPFLPTPLKRGRF